MFLSGLFRYLKQAAIEALRGGEKQNSSIRVWNNTAAPEDVKGRFHPKLGGFGRLSRSRSDGRSSDFGIVFAFCFYSKSTSVAQ